MGDVMYAKFRVGDLLGSAKLGKYHNPKDLYFDASGYRYICASNANNGVNKQMPSVNGSNLNIIGPRIIAWGKQCPMFTYHDVECVTSQGMYYYDVSALSERASLYIIGALTACVANSHYGYSNCLIGKVADELIIELPVTSSGTPDWDYMAERIAELEAERIAELEAYLVAADLDDCELTDEDKRALSLSRKSASDEDGCSAADAGLRWKEFKVGELFDIHPTAAYKLRNTELFDDKGKNPVVTNSSLKNGITGYTNRDCTEHGGMITFSDTTTSDAIFYQADDFVGYPHVQGLYPVQYVDEWDEKTLLYFAAGMRRCAFGRFSYATKFTRVIAADMCIELPVTHQGTPDWDYMRAYIRAQEKLVMAGVADMTQKRIDATREIVGGVSNGM